MAVSVRHSERWTEMEKAKLSMPNESSSDSLKTEHAE